MFYLPPTYRARFARSVPTPRWFRLGIGSKERLIKISINGLMGEIEVNGVKYNNVMAPPGIPPGSLTDSQIADVLTYIRNEWGNSASAVSASEVAAVRAATKDRGAMQMWTAAELSSSSQPAPCRTCRKERIAV